MQPYSQIIPLPNPASSKALLKLKANPLIPTQQFIIMPSTPPKSQFQGRYFGSSLPRNTSERSLSGHSSARDEKEQSDGKLKVTFHGAVHQIGKPLSALGGNDSNRDTSKLRSSSVTQFSYNDGDQKISSLEAKIMRNNQQIVFFMSQLQQKQVRIQELQIQKSNYLITIKQLENKIEQKQENDSLIKNMEELQKSHMDLTRIKESLVTQVCRQQLRIGQLQKSLQKIESTKIEQISRLDSINKQTEQKLHDMLMRYEQCNKMNKDLQQRILRINEIKEQGDRKYQEEIESHELEIRQDKVYFESLNLRIQSYGREIDMKDKENLGLNLKINDLLGQIKMIESQREQILIGNSENLREVQILREAIKQERLQKQKICNKMNEIQNEFKNARMIGQKQVQHLELLLQQSMIEKQQLLEQVQLTKLLIVQRKNAFERQVIYDLKEQNDKLWGRLIEGSQGKFKGNEQGKNIVLKKDNILGMQFLKSRQKNREGKDQNLQQNYMRFVEKLQSDDGRNGSLNVNNKNQDCNFYKEKCINLQKMVDQHLRINKSLKQQLQGYHLNDQGDKGKNPQIIFLENELKKQKILNKTLERSIYLIRQELELKLKLAEQKIGRIQNRNFYQ